MESEAVGIKSESRARGNLANITPSMWKPGSSGNPLGRPKIVTEIRELAKLHGPKALQRLVELMDSDNGKVAVIAAQAVLDRAYGKAISTLDMNVTIEQKPVASMSTDELRRIVADFRRGDGVTVEPGDTGTNAGTLAVDVAKITDESST